MNDQSSAPPTCVYSIGNGLCGRSAGDTMHDIVEEGYHDFIDEEGMVKLMWEKMNPPAEEKTESFSDICMHHIEGYGYCRKSRAHLVHAGMNISTIEHEYLEVPLVKPVGASPDTSSDEEYVTEPLIKESVPHIALRSGIDQGSLELMRLTFVAQGKEPKVRYKIKAQKEGS